jgi:hypothetical protein
MAELKNYIVTVSYPVSHEDLSKLSPREKELAVLAAIKDCPENGAVDGISYYPNDKSSPIYIDPYK